jgi:sulfate permease, SulP family
VTTLRADGHRRPPLPPPGAALEMRGAGRSANEVLAGVTLVALSVPMNIGYASVAGLPATVGIYASIVPVAVFALLTGSRRLVVGPDATIAALLAAAIAPLVANGVDAVDAALAVALLTGLLLVVGWLLGLGRLVRFLSHAVLVGFIAGLAVEILTSQVRRILAIDVEAEGWITEVVEMVGAIPDASLASVAVGGATIVIVRVLRRWLPRVPGALIALGVVGGAVAWWEPADVAVLGPVPSGLPGPTFPSLPLDVWVAVLPVALAIAVLTVAEGVLLSEAAARRHGEELEPNGEVFAYGLSNLAAAFTGGMPVGASASRTAALEATGARSQVPAVVAAIAAALVATTFTGLIAAIPLAALGGLVANAVLGLVNVPAFRHLAAVRRSEFGIALTCAIGVLVLGPLPGLAVAAIASAVDVVRRAADLPWVELGGAPHDAGTDRFARTEGPRTPQGLRLLRPEGPLFFANAATIRRVLGAAAVDADVRWVVLDLEAVSDIDPTAAEALADGLDLLRAHDTLTGFSRVREPVREHLDRYGLLERLGPDRVFPSNRAVAVAYEASLRGSATVADAAVADATEERPGGAR